MLREGVDVAFGVASGYLSAFLDAARRGRLRVVTNLHEGAAAFAACGYAMASGKLGVVYTQAGPGVTNAVSGVAAAFMDSIPQLLLATQSPTNLYGRDAHQEATGGTHGIDQLAMYTSAAHLRLRPTTADTMIRSTRRAITSALGRRTSTVLEVAADLWTQRVAFEDLAPESYRATQSAPVDVASIEKLAELLRTAKSPAILVGHRTIHRGASAELVRLCEEQDIAVATVDYAKGAIPEDHRLSLGILGSCGHDSAAEYFRDADLVIALGTRMATQTTFDFDASLFPNLVHIDELVEEPGRNMKLRMGIVSDIPGAIRALRVAAGAPVDRGVAARVGALREKHHVYRADKSRPSGTPAVLSAIREVLPRNTLVTGDSGLTLQYVKKFFPVYAADGFYALYSLAPMGSGLPLAIGVQVGRPDDTVLCVIGDGGTLVHLSELAVAAHYGLPLIVVICNNLGYKQVGDRMERYQTESYGCRIPAVDFVAAARACGCDAYAAHDAETAAAAVKTALERRTASVIEVRVDGDNLFDITPKRITQWWDSIFPKDGISNEWPFK